METVFPPCPPVRTEWRVLYRAAIYEPDRSVGSQKVAEAEKAILARERELFYGEGTLEEKDALEDALHILQALRNAWLYSNAA